MPLRRRLIVILILILLTLTVLEISLSLIDPWGVRYLHEMDFISQHLTGAPLLYRIVPGHYDFGDWSFAVDSKGRRAVPDSGAGPCTLAFFGDSVTFGWGVNDGETFSDQIAAQYPGVQTINTGVPGYNSAQIRSVIDQTVFSWGVYLITNNDADGYLTWGLHLSDDPNTAYGGFGLLHGSPSALRGYVVAIRHMLGRQTSELEKPTADPERFANDLNAIAAVPHLRIVSVDDELGRWVAAHAPVILISPYQGTVSIADAHPNAESHAAIAAQLKPIIAETRPPEC